MSRQRYTEEFKLEAVKQVTERGHPVVEVVTCHGIFPPSSIRVRSNRRTDDETSKIHGRADHRHSG